MSEQKVPQMVCWKHDGLFMLRWDGSMVCLPPTREEKFIDSLAAYICGAAKPGTANEMGWHPDTPEWHAVREMLSKVYDEIAQATQGG